jgi:two-component system sensor histidine kinase DevS
MYAGLAVGLRRYRLFDLDEWALRILTWTLAAVIFIAIELLLINAAGLGGSQSLAVTFLVALAYLPLRHWALSRFFRRGALPEHELFDRVLQVGFVQSDAERATRWRELLQRMFDPLQMEFTTVPGSNGTLAGVLADAQGVTMTVPAVASSPALKLSHPWAGRRLFASRHVRLADTIVRLMQTADASRQAFQRGVERERSRIARDLHDDVSSPLLAGLSRAPDDRVRDDIRKALTHMRSIVSGAGAEPKALVDCVSDTRFDAVNRLRHHGIDVDWPLTDIADVILGAEQQKALGSFCHEVVTNVIKHSHATHVTVAIVCDRMTFRYQITDNGVGFTPETIVTGQGLPNLHARADVMRASLEIYSAPRGGDHPGGTTIVLTMPLHSAHAPEAVPS